MQSASSILIAFFALQKDDFQPHFSILRIISLYASYKSSSITVLSQYLTFYPSRKFDKNFNFPKLLTKSQNFPCDRKLCHNINIFSITPKALPHLIHVAELFYRTNTILHFLFFKNILRNYSVHLAMIILT